MDGDVGLPAETPFTPPAPASDPCSMVLRPYQQECLVRLRERYRAGKRRVLVSLPTGTGKTVVFAELPRFFRMKKRLLVLAHREELLEQAAAKFRAVDPSISVGIEQADRHVRDERIVIASVATLRGERLARLAPEDFYLFVVDEAHHAVAPSYRAVFDHFGLFEPGTARMLIGFTATPRRGDKQSLGDVFEDIAYSKGLEEMIAADYLSRVRGYRVQTGVSLDRVKVRAGDFVESQLAETVNVGGRNDLIVRTHRELAPERHCAVFCANVEHARDLAEAFRAAGVRAEAVWGTMPRSERHDVLARFHEGATRVLTNCNVLTEGFDEPAIDCVMMARPTKSLLLYAQMVGRGTRKASGKSDLMVIDFVDNSSKHTLAALAALFALPPGFDLRGRDALATASEAREIAERMPWIDLTTIANPDQLELVVERVDLFRFEPPSAIAPVTRLAWLPDAAGGYRIGLPGGDQMLVEPTLLGDWEIRRRLRATGRTEILERKPTEQAAVRLADAAVATIYPDAIPLLRHDAHWRHREPTDKQLAALRARGLPTPEQLTRGQASWMLAYTQRR